MVSAVLFPRGHSDGSIFDRKLMELNKGMRSMPLSLFLSVETFPSHSPI
ncbi:hypothetical protein COLO4_06636 [Corchorus olitorius]|uniref:Uncharacterized protein n=1 Tax=Corchorus olitorius TaxID=93759 RepID=A0A1R3KMG0_9ROSI|nr:hypothetical protein COLO4_06636 [Corchorus olitorius]